MHLRHLARMGSRASALALVTLCAACQVEGRVRASATANESRSDESETMTVTEPPAPAAAAAAAAPAPAAAAAARGPAEAPAASSAPAPPRADACPLSCFEARGSERASVTAEEQAQLRSALEPVLGRMRACTSAEDWRQHGSPIINLRVAPDGALADLGVDPHHGRDSACFDESGRDANVSLSLPGRHVVRCAERCVAEKSRVGATPRRRGKRAP